MEEETIELGIRFLRPLFRIGGVDVWITDTIVSTWIIMGLLIALAIVTRIMLPKFKDVPTGFQNVMEAIVEFYENFAKENLGAKLMPLASWFFMAFLFVFLSNISGMFFLRPPTADWSMTFALAFASFLMIQYAAIRYKKWAYLKELCQPFPLFLPLNIIGEFARPVSLSFRLFGNILAGTILMTLLYNMAPYFLRFVLPAALHGYFDLFSGVLQTYIFCALSIAFIGNAAIVEAE